jgi:CHAT domain-containing protein/tetratricopeptide (TPR) repeat protein
VLDAAQQPAAPPTLDERLRQAEQEETKAAPDVSIKRYQELIRECQAASQAVCAGRAKLGLGRVTRRQDARSAAELILSALDSFRSAGETGLEATAHFELANTLFAGNPRDALPHYEAAASGFAKVDDQFQRGRALNGTGNVHLLTGYYDRAEASYRAACAVARDISNDTLLGRCLNNLGELTWRTGKYTDALRYHQQSLELKLRTKDELGAANAYNGLGNVYFRLGNYSKALEYYTASLAIFSTKGPSETSLVLNNIGVAMKNAERYQEALEYLEKAYEAGKAGPNLSEMALARNNQGYVYSLEGLYDKSIESHQDALRLAAELRSPEYQIHALHGIGNSQFRVGKHAEALATFAKVASLSEDIRSADESIGAHVAMGRCYERLGQPGKALAEYRAAMTGIESTRAQVQLDTEKADYLENNLEAYTNAVHLLASEGLRGSRQSLAEAFLLAERFRARALLEMLAETAARITPRLDAESAAERERLLAAITVVQGQLRQLASGGEKPDPERVRVLWGESDRLYDAYELLQARVRTQDPQYASLHASQPIGLPELQKLLAGDTALIEYAFDHRRNLMGLPREPWGIAFVVTAEGSTAFEIPNVSQLGELALRLRSSLTAPAETGQVQERPDSEFVQAASELHKLLIAPARKMLEGKKHVVIIPDRFVTGIPFEALLTSAPTGKAGSTWDALPYLVRRFAVAYAPSATIYAELEKRPPTGRYDKQLLAVADPAYQAPSNEAPASALPRLVHSAKEAQDVAALFDSAQADVLMRERANEDEVRASISRTRYRYLLFSVHGLTDPRYPQFSWLAFSTTANSSSDGLLQVHEIYSLRLDSDVAVLSACETGLGKNVQGEGLIGLTRAFLYAGSRSVVGSLWSVQDDSTAVLMRQFFAAITARGPAGALQSAKLDLLKQPKYAHPFYWAPFVLSGYAAAPARAASAATGARTSPGGRRSAARRLRRRRWLATPTPA